MSKRFEYSIATRKDDYGDDTQFIFRETTASTGLVVAEEVARLDYGDIKHVTFPDGLVRPTEEETALYTGEVGKKIQESSSELADTAVYGPATNMTQIEQNITDFVVKALSNGRQPIFAWTEIADDDEIRAFQKAAGRVQEIHDDSRVDSSDTPNESYGLYL